MLRTLEKRISELPEGTLKYKTKHGKMYFYRQVKQTKGWKEIYIKKQDGEIAKQLAQKSYLQKTVRVLQEQLRALYNFKASYDDIALDRIYDELPEERKQLIEPLTGSVQSRIRAWEEENYQPYDAYPEHKIYETDRGELVRSKSEVIIANLLHQYRKDIDYKYERPLMLRTKNSGEITVHPDFTIINRNTGRIYYYEHAGKMDDPKYGLDFVRKMDLYTANNILQGKNLLITYEAASAPLSLQSVRKIIEIMLEDV